MTRVLRLLTTTLVLQVCRADWKQLGEDIDGEHERDFSGGTAGAIAMSKDGRILAIGAPGNDASGDGAGHVRIFEMRGAAWMQRGSDIDGEAGGDGSGRTVAMSDAGDIVAIGASDNRGTSDNRFAQNFGHVRVYKWYETSGEWSQLGDDIDGVGKDDRLSGMGRAIALSADGNTMAVGAYGNNNEAGPDAGHVRIFDLQNAGWVQRGSAIHGEQGRTFRGDWFGGDVALSADGNTMAAGAMFNDAEEWESKSGHVRVFDWHEARDGHGDWVQRGGDIDGENGDYSGSSLAMSTDGLRVAVGSPRVNDYGEIVPGRVRVYDWTSALEWVQRGQTISSEVVKDEFGKALAMNEEGTIVAVGAYLHNAPKDTEGHVRVFAWDGSGWVQRGTAIAGENQRDYSGYSVAMDASGNVVASGARYTDDAGHMAGHVRVFRYESPLSPPTQITPASTRAESPGTSSGATPATSPATSPGATPATSPATSPGTSPAPSITCKDVMRSYKDGGCCNEDRAKLVEGPRNFKKLVSCASLSDEYRTDLSCCSD